MPLKLSLPSYIGSIDSSRRITSPGLMVAALALTLAWAGVAAADAVRSSRHPNIVFILADDLGRGHVGCYGQTKIRTPNIDRMAAEGMKFENAYAGANVCAPARSVLMTGLHAGHTAVCANGATRHLYDEDTTVAEVLKGAGYATGGFGKWGLGEETTPGVAVNQGFDAWFGQYNQQHAHFFYPYFLMNGRDRFMLPENEGGKQARYAHDEIHAQALKFIRDHKGGPFFAYLPYILPHVELTVPADSRREYEDKFPRISRADPRPGYLGSDHAHAEFAGMVTRLDRHVGEVLALLKELQLDENTIVFFTSDNGPQPGAWTDIFVEYFDGNGVYRGAKGDFYEGGIRVPLIARWPGQIQPGTTSDVQTCFYDVLPTLAELAGVDKLPPTDGMSLVPTLLGRGDQPRHEFLYWETPSGRSGGEPTYEQAVRTGDWKLHKFPGKKPVELYNLADDPSETKNVAADNSSVVAKLEEIMRREHTPERNYPADTRGLNAKSFVK
ncbi:MAG: arylsulfatase [Pirellulales bacterium]